MYKFSLNSPRFLKNEESSSETSTHQTELLRLKLSSQNEKFIEVKKNTGAKYREENWTLSRFHEKARVEENMDC